MEDPLAGAVLARRLTRLAAAILDNLIFVVPMMILLIAMVGTLDPGTNGDELTALVGMAMVLAALPVLLINLFLLAQSGQTMGKKLLRIRIVRASGEAAGLARIVFLRYLAMGAVSWIPFIGFVIGLLNVLFIFGEQRRCIHDYFADTKVVTV